MYCAYSVVDNHSSYRVNRHMLFDDHINKLHEHLLEQELVLAWIFFVMLRSVGESVGQNASGLELHLGDDLSMGISGVALQHPMIALSFLNLVSATLLNTLRSDLLHCLCRDVLEYDVTTTNKLPIVVVEDDGKAFNEVQIQGSDLS